MREGPSPATDSMCADDAVPYGRQLTARAQATPHEAALTIIERDGRETTLTWGELDASANQWARVLGSSTVDPGAIVALAIPNSVALVVAALATWKIGATPIPMRWDLPDWEHHRLLDAVSAALVVDLDNVEDLAEKARAQNDSPLPEAVSLAQSGICSSGSTGLPKIILNTAPALWTSATSEPFISHWKAVNRPQKILVPGPMYHTNGFNTLNYLLGGDRLIVLEKFDAGQVLDAIERHHVTTFTATPTMLSRIADVPGIEKRNLSTIDWILQGAAVMPQSLLQRWFEILTPEQIVMAYGMTENLGLTALRGDEWLEHRGSVGRGFRDTEIRVVDDDGVVLGPGQFGEICLRAPMNDQYRYIGGAAPLPTTDDGFTSAGDLGYLDEDGYLFIVDRRTDMIVTGGANVFPAEVESALIEHPDVVDVVVIGLSDPQWGRRVHAVVQSADGSTLTDSAVIQHAKNRLAGYKVPKSVEFVDEMPRTAATKVNRSAMTEARGG